MLVKVSIKKLLFYFNNRKIEKRITVLTKSDIRDFLKIIGYSFNNFSLLEMALKHKSFSDGETFDYYKTNERLEFLGDSVLGMVISAYLYKRYQQSREGELAKMKSMIVSGINLSKAARNISLGSFIILSESEELSGGRDKDSLLEDSFEALIGAIYLDGGIKEAEKFIEKFIISDIESFSSSDSYRNFKSELMELVQAKGDPAPTYRIVSETGPEHDKIFTVEAIISGKIYEQGSGKSRKKAEKEAAKLTLLKLEEELKPVEE